jgi:hypothetical protein
LPDALKEWSLGGSDSPGELLPFLARLDENIKVGHYESLTKDERDKAHRSGLKYLMIRTVLVDAVKYRFEHSRWQEFLEALHLADCIEQGNITGLCHRGTLTRMHILSGEIYACRDQVAAANGTRVQQFKIETINAIYQRAVDLGLHEQTGDHWTKPAAQIPLGNLLGVVGHSTRSISLSAISRLTANCILDDKCPRLLRVVALQTLGFRALRAQRSKGDPSGTDVQETVKSAVKELLKNQHTPSFLAMVASCLASALGLQTQYRNLSFIDSACLEDAIRLVSTPTGESRPNGQPEYTRSGLDDTMQEVFLQLRDLIPFWPDKLLPFVTYTVPLFAACKFGDAQSEVKTALQLYFTEGKDGNTVREIIEQAVINDPNLKPLETLWNSMRDNWEKTVGQFSEEPNRSEQFSGTETASKRNC